MGYLAYILVFFSIYGVLLTLFLWLDIHVNRHRKHSEAASTACEGRCLEKPVDGDDDGCRYCTETSPVMKRRRNYDEMFSRLHCTYP
ncbi:hypothetical protein IWQ56_000651 [Coemansia nantahalensis]|uniref:Uncharacterized protein n=1 Tax=Coemansia helicoidea TaxID=1286919 RepID=A0ACC1LGC2_9FUNG|nr:hypothetical protein IWQ56_000651 [Coemansia nantahalensis]KAJ2807003.1 hypothetical protein H4R21_000653 [Coemansia helicoidea]